MTCKAAVTGGLSAGPAERECVGCEIARFHVAGPGQHVAAFGIGDGDLVLDERPAGRVPVARRGGYGILGLVPASGNVLIGPATRSIYS